MPVAIIRTAWAGTSGGPGLTQTAFRNVGGTTITTTEAQSAVNAVRAFWNAIASLVPDEIVLTVSPVVDIYNQVDGELMASVTAATPPLSVGGTSTAVYAMASGMKVNLNTGVIRFGRRVRGAIYVVPAASTIYNNTGAVSSAHRTTVNSAGATMLAAFASAGLAMVVYSRPQVAPTVRAGAISDISGIETNEKGAVLRGRRD